MTPPHKNFKGQLDDEVVVCVFRRHWISVLSNLVVIPILLLLIFLAFHNLPVLMGAKTWVDFLVVFGFVSLHILIHRQFISVFNHFLQTVVLTDRRIVIVDKTVFFRDFKTTVDITNIQDIQKTQGGLMQTLFNYGSLVFMLSGSSGSLTIDLVPRPEYQFKKITEVKMQLQATPPPVPETPPTPKWRDERDSNPRPLP